MVVQEVIYVLSLHALAYWIFPRLRSPIPEPPRGCCMDSLPSTPSDASMLPQGCQQLGRLGASLLDAAALASLDLLGINLLDLLLVLAATRTAEHEGISAAGSTAASQALHGPG